VAAGRAKAIVVGVGSNTAMGSIRDAMLRTEDVSSVLFIGWAVHSWDRKSIVHKGCSFEVHIVASSGHVSIIYYSMFFDAILHGLLQFVNVFFFSHNDEISINYLNHLLCC
jgi:magnesium-transporting ATPase (P-type)